MTDSHYILLALAFYLAGVVTGCVWTWARMRDSEHRRKAAYANLRPDHAAEVARRMVR